MSHQSVDSRHGIIVDVEVTPGNVNDSHPYLERIEYMRNHLGLPIEAAGADKAYGKSLICRRLQEMGIRLYTPRVASGIHYQAEFTRKEFQYEEETDSFVCPGGKHLLLRSLEREEYNICRVYRADKEDCQSCAMSSRCLSAQAQKRTLRVNIFEEAVKKCREREGTAMHTHILNMRQIWCEGSFAAQKARHNLRSLYRRGQEAAEAHCLLSAMALSMKRMVKCLG